MTRRFARLRLVGLVWLLAPVLLLAWWRVQPVLLPREVGWTYYSPITRAGLVGWLLPAVLLLGLGLKPRQSDEELQRQ